MASPKCFCDSAGATVRSKLSLQLGHERTGKKFAAEAGRVLQSGQRDDEGLEISRESRVETMRHLWWILISVVGALICGAVAVFATQGGAGTQGAAAVMSDRGSVPKTSFGQAAPTPVQEAQQVRQPAAAPPAAPARPAPEALPHRVETTDYNSWTVTCEETVGGAAKKSCVANYRVVNQQGTTLANWEIGKTPQGKFITAIHIPSTIPVRNGDKTVGAPISIPEGIELKFGNGVARRLNFVTCGAQQCVAEAPIDETFAKEAAASLNATVTVHTPGGALPFELGIKGIDKAIAYTR